MQNVAWMGVAAAMFGLSCGPVAYDSAADSENSVEAASNAQHEADAKLERLIEMSTKDVEFYLLDGSAPDGSIREPVGFLQVAEARTVGHDLEYRLEGINGVIFREDDDDLTFEAHSGVFDDKTNHARLQGPISLSLEGVTGALNEMEWDSDEKVIRSQEASTFRAKNMEIRSNSMVLQPSNGRLLLGNFDAEFQLGGHDR